MSIGTIAIMIFPMMNIILLCPCKIMMTIQKYDGQTIINLCPPSGFISAGRGEERTLTSTLNLAQSLVPVCRSPSTWLAGIERRSFAGVRRRRDGGGRREWWWRTTNSTHTGEVRGQVGLIMHILFRFSILMDGPKHTSMFVLIQVCM